MKKTKASDIDLSIQDRADAFNAVAAKLNTAANRDLVLAEIDKLIVIEDQAPQKDALITELRGQIADFEEKVKVMFKDNEKVQLKNDQLTAEVAKAQKTIQEQGAKIEGLSGALEGLKTQVAELSAYSSMTGWQLIRKGVEKLIHR